MSRKNGTTASPSRPLILTAVVPFPASGDLVGVHLLYDLNACLSWDERMWGSVGDLMHEDRRIVRAVQRARVAFYQDHPNGAPPAPSWADVPTSEEWAAHEAVLDAFYAAQEAYQGAITALMQERGRNNRALALRTIEALLAGVTWAAPDGVEPPEVPDPHDAASWDAWPTFALEWIIGEGKRQAEAELTGKKWNSGSIASSILT